MAVPWHTPEGGSGPSPPSQNHSQPLPHSYRDRWVAAPPGGVYARFPNEQDAGHLLIGRLAKIKARISQSLLCSDQRNVSVQRCGRGQVPASHGCGMGSPEACGKTARSSPQLTGPAAPAVILSNLLQNPTLNWHVTHISPATTMWSVTTTSLLLMGSKGWCPGLPGWGWTPAKGCQKGLRPGHRSPDRTMSPPFLLRQC